MIIQDSDQGHDPCEDARAALLLYQRYEKEFEATAVRREAENYNAATKRSRRGLQQAPTPCMNAGENMPYTLFLGQRMCSRFSTGFDYGAELMCKIFFCEHNTCRQRLVC